MYISVSKCDCGKKYAWKCGPDIRLWTHTSDKFCTHDSVFYLSDVLDGSPSCKHCYTPISPWLGLTQAHMPVQREAKSLPVSAPQIQQISENGGDNSTPVSSLGVDLSCAGQQLVPAHHPFTQVHLIQPHVRLANQGLFYELAAVWNQKELRGIGIACLNSHQGIKNRPIHVKVYPIWDGYNIHPFNGYM